jgi:hypothetical protein
MTRDATFSSALVCRLLSTPVDLYVPRRARVFDQSARSTTTGCPSPRAPRAGVLLDQKRLTTASIDSSPSFLSSA